MTITKLLGLLYDHIEDGDLSSFEVYHTEVHLHFSAAGTNYIDLQDDLLRQYNEIFKF